jgi:hypothetical protein
VNDLEMGQVFIRALHYSCQHFSVSAPYLQPKAARTRRPKGEAWEHLEKQFCFGNRGALHIKTLPLFSIFKGRAAHKSVGNPMTCTLRK